MNFRNGKEAMLSHISPGASRRLARIESLSKQRNLPRYCAYMIDQQQVICSLRYPCSIPLFVPDAAPSAVPRPFPIVDPAPQGVLDSNRLLSILYKYTHDLPNFSSSRYFYFQSIFVIHQALSLDHRTLWWDFISLRSPRSPRTRTSKSSKRKSTILSPMMLCCARRFKSPAVSTEMAIRGLP